jgi:hypothetical protein
MEKTGSRGLLVNLGRIILFVVSIIFALGWLVAPDVVAKQRDRVAAFVRLPAAAGVRVSPPGAQQSRSDFRHIAAHTD